MSEENKKIKDSFKSIKAPTEGLYKEKGSKFISFAYPVEDEEEIKEILKEVCAKYYDARHHCFAYKLGFKGDRFRANDDGEPNNSAGVQILGHIESRELSDVLVVVIRYFGGIKLGIPGLIRAYRTATSDALDNAEVIEKIATKRYKIHFKYPQMNDVMRVLKGMDLPQFEQNFMIECDIQTKVRLSLVDEFLDQLKGINCDVIELSSEID